MAPAMATGRLRKELVKLQKEPPPGVIAEPDESNILKWHYAVRGPSGTAFEGGVYIGKLVFPSEYPMKPPGIMMLTPSGRFKVNMRLCLSMSDFHPESWNPMWSVATIIQGVQSFMASDELTTGGLKSPANEHRRFAAASMDYNRKMFPNLFSGDMDAAFASADKARAASEAKAASSATSSTSTDTSARSKSVRNRRSKRDKQPLSPPGDDSNDSNDGTEEKKKDDEPEPKKELTPEEIEKRRKRNAKKRAKQKQKKNNSDDPNREQADVGEADDNDDCDEE
jgi:ubiquitin-conjugating enzyme E2 J2